MTKPPEKTKPREEWSVAEIVQHNRTGEEPVSDDWRSYIRDVATAAGVTAQDLGAPAEEKDPAEFTVAEHFDRIRRHRD